MNASHVVIVGGGLAGLSAGCYARESGFETTILEHGTALGGVCTSWDRPPYRIDGCIHWLTGGPFDRIYGELGLDTVERRVLEYFSTYRDARTGIEIRLTRDLDLLASTLAELAPEDSAEVQRLLDGARRVAHLTPPLDKPEELMTLTDGLRALWGLRHDLSALARFRVPFAEYAARHLRSDLVRRWLGSLVPPEAPTMFLLMELGYLERGFLSRPVGGTRAFLDTLVARYAALGGKWRPGATVERVIVEDGVARGVQLAGGETISADAVISTSSMPETVMRLLDNRFGAEDLNERLARWKLFDPIVIASYGVASPYADSPSTLVLDRLPPFSVGGLSVDRITVRTFNDEPSCAPPGHTVVQAIVPTEYGFWATRGEHYDASKAEVAGSVLDRLELTFPGIRAAVRSTDVATPITFWNKARSWRGAYEGWIPTSEAFFSHVSKRLPRLDGFYMAGQWVEPGGGVPTALSSGRKAVQLLCSDRQRAFGSKSPEVAAQTARASAPTARPTASRSSAG